MIPPGSRWEGEMIPPGSRWEGEVIPAGSRWEGEVIPAGSRREGEMIPTGSRWERGRRLEGVEHAVSVPPEHQHPAVHLAHGRRVPLPVKDLRDGQVVPGDEPAGELVEHEEIGAQALGADEALQRLACEGGQFVGAARYRTGPHACCFDNGVCLCLL